MSWIGWTVALLLAAGGTYAVSCTWWPFARCLRCEGEGKLRRGDGKVWRPCKRCKGSGARLRVGRKVWNYLHAQRKAAR